MHVDSNIMFFHAANMFFETCVANVYEKAAMRFDFY